MKNVFIDTVRQYPNLSIAQIDEFWKVGVDLNIAANTALDSVQNIKDSALFITKGIVREYYSDNNEEEYTTRLMQQRDFVLPSLSSFFVNRPTKLKCHTLTPLSCRSWKLMDVVELANNQPNAYKILIQQIALELRKKDQRDLRLQELTAQERYCLFLDEYPGMVNLIPLKHVASYLGMTPETVSRIRAEIGNFRNSSKN